MFVRRTMLFLTAGALATGGVLAAAPAHAASAPATYTCTTVLGDVPATVVTDTNLPALMHVGQSLPVGLSSTVTVPWFQADGTTGTAIEVAYDLLGARTASGSATANGTITGPGGFKKTSVTQLTVPTSAIDQGVGLTTNASGTGTVAFAPKLPGVYTVTAGDFSSALTFLKDDGTDTGLGVQTIPCTAPTSAPKVDTVTVKAATTTTLTLSRSRVAYPKRVVATATVKATGGSATGTVRFTVAGRTYNVAVHSGKATMTLPALHPGTKRVTARYNGATYYDASNTATKSFAVSRAGTHAFASVKNGHLHKVLRTVVTVTSAARTPNGRVTIVLQRAGHRVISKVVSLRNGRRAVTLKRINKVGNYTVKVTYAGNSDLLSSRVVKHFRVHR